MKTAPLNLEVLPPQVLKLKKLVQELRVGGSAPVTRLTVLKTLCREPKVAQGFVLYLLRLAIPSPASLRGTPEEKRLATTALGEMSARVAEAQSQGRSRDLFPLLAEIRGQQNEVKQIRGWPVRMIKNKQLLLVENALQSFVSPELAGYWAYYTAREHAERYDSHYGTGLIPASAKAVADIADFWLNPEARTVPSAHASRG